MADEQTYVGQTMLEPEGYLQPRRYRIECLCHRCGNRYHYETSKLTADDRPCPKKKCRAQAHEERVMREAENMARILETRTPPGHIGDKPIVQAIDKTAEIVMQDHGMTDLRDNIRPGEAMAPKLPPPMQKAADNFFTAQPVVERGGNSRQAELLKRRAIAGAFRGMAINPGAVTPGTPGQSPMRLVRTEKI